MAPKPKPLEKGQRPISSFFCKKPAENTRPTAAALQRKPEQPNTSPAAAGALTADGQPPLKRQRTQDSSLRDHHALSAASPQPAPAKRTNGATAGAPQAGASTGLLNGDSRMPDTSTGLQEPHAQPRRVGGASAEEAAARHQRFQNKLVLGAPVGRRGESAEDIVPQPRTPLEQQVDALKRRHPGMLLLIEVQHLLLYL